MLDFSHPIVIGLAVGLPSVALGFFVYRATVKRDKFTERAGVAASQVGAVAQVIEGLNLLVDSLQEDNKILRDAIEELRKRLDKATQEQLEFIKQVSDLKNQLQQYQIKDTAMIDAASREIKDKVNEKMEAIKTNGVK